MSDRVAARKIEIIRVYGTRKHVTTSPEVDSVRVKLFNLTVGQFFVSGGTAHRCCSGGATVVFVLFIFFHFYIILTCTICMIIYM